jgi:hypothetical protein
MEPLGHGAIRFLHRGDLREHLAFPVRLALFARGPRRASAFNSWARSLIAARSSSVNPLDFLLFAVVLLADFCVPFFAGLLSASAKHLLRTAQRCSWMPIMLPARSRKAQSRTAARLLGRLLNHVGAAGLQLRAGAVEGRRGQLSSRLHWGPDMERLWSSAVARELRGYETGTLWDWRALAGTRDVSRHGETCSRHAISRLTTRKVPANRPSASPAPAQRRLPPSLGRASMFEVTALPDVVPLRS